MTLKNFGALISLFILIFATKVDAAENLRIAVVDFAKYDKNFSKDQQILADFIIENLIDNKKMHFYVLDFEILEDVEWLESVEKSEDAAWLKNLDSIENLSPMLREYKIANHFNVDYLILLDSINGLKFEIEYKNGNPIFVKSKIISHLLNIKTGNIVRTVKCEGVENYKSYKNKVSQITLRNATYKAAFSVVNKLMENFSES